MKENEPGQKKPVTMELNVPPSMKTLITSTTDGGFKLIEGHEGTEQRANFFELDEDSTVLYDLIDSIFVAGAKNDWGGVALRDTLTKDYLESVESYFLDYEIDIYQIISGMRGIKELDSTSLYSPPKDCDHEELQPDLLDEWMDEHLHAGRYRGEVPVFYNESMNNYFIVTAEPELIGQMNQVGEFANLLVHNPQFGLVITKLEDVDE